MFNLDDMNDTTTTGMEVVYDIASTEKRKLSRITEVLFDIFPNNTIAVNLTNPQLTKLKRKAILGYLKDMRELVPVLVPGEEKILRVFDTTYVPGSRYILGLFEDTDISDTDSVDTRNLVYNVITGKTLI